MRGFQIDSTSLAALSQPLTHPDRHTRHILSRRAFLSGTAGMSAAAVGAGLLRPTAAFAAKPFNGTPKPTTTIFPLVVNGVELDFHVTNFGPGMDPATITDFNGFVGVADVQGDGTATNADGSTETLLFDTDLRFMTGVYVGQDGRTHKGTFGFV
jgi:hypothetical protein